MTDLDQTTTMPTRPLGASDLQVSVVGLGCNNFGRRLDLEGTRAVVDAAIEEGVTFLDTADVYGGPDNAGASETLLGQALEGRRDAVVLATKFGMEMRLDDAPDAARGSRAYIRWAIEGSLRRLRTDVIDLYQYHRPDGVTPIEETLGELNELVREGKVRHVGCSNFDAAQLEEAAQVAEDQGLSAFVSVQNEYSLLERGIERDVVPAAERLNVSVIPYFPLASGLLTGKYRRGAQAPEGTRLHGRDEIATDVQFDAIEALDGLARERGISLLDVAIAGLAAQPAVASVIAGATKPEQVRANAAAGDWEPTDDELAEIDQLAPTKRP